jgi:hypothetical protein
MSGVGLLLCKVRNPPRFRLQPFADDAGALLAGG